MVYPVNSLMGSLKITEKASENRVGYPFILSLIGFAAEQESGILKAPRYLFPSMRNGRLSS